ncbi:MAG: transcriptional repressor LexA [Alphaproteobacteria bacterium]|nr:transcriptional repressor LexA [Alphaproteobacteria bacterium]
MLTRKQYETLITLNRHLLKDGVVPSYFDLAKELGLSSKSSVFRLISSLEERGFIRKIPHKARALEILKLPENVPQDNLPVSNDYLVRIPKYGKIAAGSPIEALTGNDKICVPSDMVGNNQCYALTVSGDSMIEAGINDGDIVIIKRCDIVENGEIAVALVDDNEATLKRVYFDNSKQICLKPANKQYRDFIYSKDRVKIQGKLVGLLRYCR